MLDERIAEQFEEVEVRELDLREDLTNCIIPRDR